MSLEDQVRWRLLTYPSLYDRRIDVLHYMFCISSEGLFGWHKGELVDLQDRRSAGIFKETPVDPKEPDWMQDLVRKVNSQRKERWERHRRDIDALCASPDATLRNGAHPIDRSAKLLNLPDDVKPEWLAGAREVIESLYAYQATDEDGPASAKAHSRNLALADKALADIHRRFGREPGEARCFREWKALRALESLVSYKDDDDLDFNGGRPGKDFGSDECWRATLYGEKDMLHVFACYDDYDDFLVVRSWTDDVHRSEESRLNLDGMISAAREFAGKAEPAATPTP